MATMNYILCRCVFHVGLAGRTNVHSWLLGTMLLLDTSVATAALPVEQKSGIDALASKVHLVTSPYQRGTVKIRVLLPDDIKPLVRYRCLYVLPVEAGDQHRYGDGLRACRDANIHNRYQLICVAPTFSDLPWYADHPTDPQLRQESHFIKFVVPFVDQHYPVIRAARGRLLVGFSKSGWGAWSLLLRNPKLFERAAAWDAPLMLDRPDRYGMGPIFGSQANFTHYQISRLLASRAALLTDSSRLCLMGFGNFRDHHQRAHALMDKLRIRHSYADGPEREHTWNSGWLVEAVQELVSDR